jgi:hypothetical protein
LDFISTQVKTNSTDKLSAKTIKNGDILTGVKVSKVIDLMPRLKTVNTTSSDERARFEMMTEPKESPVINFTESKQKMLFHERRQVKRTILTEYISSMVVVPEKGLMKVSIHDISEEGISFDVEEAQGQFKIGEEISLRVYINQKAYFPIQVNIKHVTAIPDEGQLRHGTVFLKNADNNVALQHFVKFVESASFGLKNDSGDLMVPRIS